MSTNGILGKYRCLTVVSGYGFDEPNFKRTCIL